MTQQIALGRTDSGNAWGILTDAEPDAQFPIGSYVRMVWTTGGSDDDHELMINVAKLFGVDVFFNWRQENEEKPPMVIVYE